VRQRVAPRRNHSVALDGNDFSDSAAKEGCLAPMMGSMADIASRKSMAALKPLAPGLSPEVQDWVEELRRVWVATGLSLNQFASVHPIDKGSVSRYLNGQRVPRDRWFLDKILAIQAASGQAVTPAVREHLTELHLRALAIAHPHEYRVRLVSDELEIAVTGKLEAERYARDLEHQLAASNQQVAELVADMGRLQTALDAERTTTRTEFERVTGEIDRVTGQLHQARERAAKAEWRCEVLEQVLDHLDSRATADEVGDAPGSDFTGLRLSSVTEIEELSLVHRSLAATTVAAAQQVSARAQETRRSSPSGRRRASNGWESLTKCEMKIAGFLEEGLTNAQIAVQLRMSRRTVGTHISHIMKKLEVSSRAEIARESALHHPSDSFSIGSEGGEASSLRQPADDNAGGRR
jgi:DNA-binding CsgD family transcriptional regulator